LFVRVLDGAISGLWVKKVDGRTLLLRLWAQMRATNGQRIETQTVGQLLHVRTKSLEDPEESIQ